MEISKPVITEDGSHTLKLEGKDEHYHSTFGAISESMHVFIEAGLTFTAGRSTSPLKILEIGLGTGLNVLLTINHASKGGLIIDYTGLEPYPLDRSMWMQLNYPDLVEEAGAGEWFRKIHESAWESIVEISPSFRLRKHKIKLQDFDHPEKAFHLIYFDAFSPDIQAELWIEEIFRKLSLMTKPEGVLVTYSAKGRVRRALESVGYNVERLPGPRGKREMIRAVKI